MEFGLERIEGLATFFPRNISNFISFTTLATVIGIYALYYLYLIITFSSSIKELPGPARDSWWFGNPRREGMNNIEMYCGLQEKYGGAVKLAGALGKEYLFLSDPVAVKYTLAGGFDTPQFLLAVVRALLGPGLIASEGDDHRRQRHIQIPAFAPSSLRAAHPSFLHCTYKLRDRFNQLIDDEISDPKCWKNEAAAQAYQDAKKSNEPKETILDANFWGFRLALDVVGKAGFSIDIDSISSKEGEEHTLLVATQTFASGIAPTTGSRAGFQLAIIFIMLWLSIFKSIPVAAFGSLRVAFRLMHEESVKFITEKKAEIAEDGINSLGEGKDIMTALFRANMTETKNKLSDAELIGQLPTFLLVGSETTGASFCWLVHTLSQNLDMQSRLRLELREARKKSLMEFGRSELSFDELEALPYLSSIICESLRLFPPLTGIFKQAKKTHSIPLSKPIFSKTANKYLDHILVHKGQLIAITTSAMNRNKEIFGKDAHEFNPERWQRENLGAGIGSATHLMSFANGRRSCPAHRFAIMELKTAISVIIDEFEVFPREESLKVDYVDGVTVVLPYVVGEGELGGRMPVRMRRAAR